MPNAAVDIKSNSTKNVTVFPPVGDLIRETWEVTKTKWKAFLKVMLLTAGIEIGLALIVLIAVLGVSFAGLESLTNLEQIVTQPLFWVAMLVWAIPAMVVGIASSVATYRLAYESLDDMPTLELLKSSVKYVGPMLLTGLVMGLLVFGGFLALVVPGLIFMILFAFASFEVLFQDQSPVNALKRSAALVSQNFGSIFIRWLAFMGVMIVVGIFTGILEGILGKDSVLNGIVQLVTNFVTAVFGTVYMTLLYKQVRTVSNDEKQYSLVWVVIVAILGWVVSGLILATAAAGIGAYLSRYQSLPTESIEESYMLPESGVEEIDWENFPQAIEDVE